MKAFLFALLISTGIQSAYAQPVGGPTRHLLNCDTPKNQSGQEILGKSYQVECSTMPVAPRYSLRGCSLISRSTSVTAKAVILDFKVDHQNIYLGYLSEENLGLNIQMTVVKPAKRADVVWGNNDAVMTCLAAE